MLLFKPLQIANQLGETEEVWLSDQPSRRPLGRQGRQHGGKLLSSGTGGKLPTQEFTDDKFVRVAELTRPVPIRADLASLGNIAEALQESQAPFKFSPDLGL